MPNLSLRPWIAFGVATSFAVALAQLSACAEGTLQESTDAAPDVVFHPRPGGGGASDASTVVCTANPCVVGIALGGSHTCALIKDGSVLCWGDNVAGELGPSSDAGVVLSQSSTPRAVSGISGAFQVAAGGVFTSGTADYDMTCAATGTGPLCWGSNQYALLGRGPAYPPDTVAHPDLAPVTTLTTGANLAIGQTNACALLGSSFACWGENSYSQLGVIDSGTTSSAPITMQLPGGKKVIQAALGYGHVCAVLDDQTVACWGYDYYGQCGTTYTTSSYSLPTPTLVPGLSGVTHVAAGSYHTCALTAAGAIMCFGYNYGGLLGGGDDGGTSSTTPVTATLPAGRKATGIAAGEYSTCALLDDGTVACWGYNSFGQLGFMPDGGYGVQGTPTLVPGLAGVDQIAMGAGSEHVCAVLHGGGLKCWGANQFGQLGSGTDGGTLAQSATPLDVQF